MIDIGIKRIPSRDPFFWIKLKYPFKFSFYHMSSIKIKKHIFSSFFGKLINSYSAISWIKTNLNFPKNFAAENRRSNLIKQYKLLQLLIYLSFNCIFRSPESTQVTFCYMFMLTFLASSLKLLIHMTVVLSAPVPCWYYRLMQQQQGVQEKKHF